MSSAEEIIRRATTSQQIASDPSLSAWVSASAGSGKTKVLIDRYIRLLLAQKTPAPEKILCLTYTRAAAAQMVEKVMNRLGDWAICNDEKLAKDLADLTGAVPRAATMKKARGLFAAILDCPGGLRIKTFHAFAQEILARFPVEARVPPHFTPLEDHEAAQIRDAALDHILAADQPGLRGDWRLLASHISAEDISGLLKSILHKQGYFAAALVRHGGLDGIQRALCRHLQIPHNADVEATLREACDDRKLPLADLQTAVWLYNEGKMTATNGKAAAALQEWLASPVPERVQNFEVYKSFFLTKSSGDPKKSVIGKKLAQSFPALEESLLQAGQKIFDLVARLESIRRAQLTMAALRLGQALQQEYQAQKDYAAALDFNDLIVKAVALLQRSGIAPWILWKLDGGINHIMIDEAQDTSRLQWQIIEALADEFFSGIGQHEEERTLFVVGDEKQSIYSFQHADPDSFHAMRARFASRAQQADKRFKKIVMDVSFRSAPKILESVDAVFRDDAARHGVSAAPVAHYARRQDAQGVVVLWPPATPVTEAAKNSAWESPREYRLAAAPHAMLAAQIAADIQDWLKSGQIVNGVRRIVHPGDILVLVRRRNEFVQALVRELKIKGIPVSGVDRMQLNAQIGVLDLLALMQFALLPEDDLNLACVLRSPFIGMDEAHLENLCFGRSGSLWQALRADSTSAARKATVWLEKVWGSADRATPYDFLMQILTLSCPAAESGRMAMLRRLGPDATDPIDELLNRAQEFALRRAPSLQNFLFLMRRDDSEIKRELEHDAGQVRIMTVHAAKGLEAPIVILPDTCALPPANKIEMLQWDDEKALPYYIGGARDAYADALQSRAHQAALEEHRRLLYVALTRAADQLHIYGYHGLRGSGGDDWHRLVRRALCPDAEDAADQPLIILSDPPGAAQTEEDAAQGEIASSPLPAWARTPAAPESTPRVLHPSQLGRHDGAAVSPARDADRLQAQRGKVLHRMLQFLPDFPAADRGAAADRFLARHWRELQPEQRATYAAEVLRIIGNPDYAALFAPGSRAEISIAGRIGAAKINGQIDRLAETENEILIVDYKTSRPPPDTIAAIPAPYLRQMAAYRILLQQIAPKKDVRCFLLWTYTGTMMELMESELGRLDLAAA